MSFNWPTIDNVPAPVVSPVETQQPRKFCTLLLRGCQTRFHATEADLLAAEELISEDAPRLHFRYSAEHGQYFAHNIHAPST